MQEDFRKLASALRERLTIIADEESRQNAERHMARLQQASERIDLLERELSPALDAQLRHYLQRRSYSKALEHRESL